MRSHMRAALVLALAVGLVALFLQNINLRRVVGDIARAKPQWLAVSLAMTLVSLVIRAWRWKFLLDPLGPTTFGSAFRATAVGYAATSVLPARAGEVIRPYFLARTAPQRDRMTATGAFATIILERLLDTITVLILLALFVFVFDRDISVTSPVAFAAVKWSGAMAAVVSGGALVVLFVVAGDPSRFGRAWARLEQVVPSALAGVIARIAEKFAIGLGAIRRPGRLFLALVWSFPLWLSICFGIWAVTEAFGLNVPFTGAFLLDAVLVLGVAVPTPGAVGGFHEAFRIAATVFFAAPEQLAVAAAIVLHLLSIGPSLFLGLVFAAQAGLNIGGMRRLADRAHAHPGPTA
jgi:uncharacterized protein (TIRG00374 family)